LAGIKAFRWKLFQESLNSELFGVQALWGNLLNWTDGKCQAAWTLRYHQAIRLRAAKLIVDEINEASEVVKELI
jgi:hypothetical protein